MGARASVLESANEEDVANYIAGLSGGLNKHEDLFRENGVDGKLLTSLANDDEALEILVEIGIKSNLHRRRLVIELQGAKPSSGKGSSDTAAADVIDITKMDTVTKPPRELIGKLFQSQGIDADPEDLKMCVMTLVSVIKNRKEAMKASGIPFGEYDCFLNYRVRTDQKMVELLCSKLLNAGLKPFFDKECLVPGEGWKVGFLRGLQASSCFVACMSSDGLEQARDLYIDHSKDNVLLEYEMALAINEDRMKKNHPEFVIPLLVGKSDGRSLSKFRDFDLTFYADSVVAVKKEIDTSSITECIKALLDKSATTPDTSEKVAGALMKIADDSDDNQVSIAKEGGIKPLISMLSDGSATAGGKENAAAALKRLGENAEIKKRIWWSSIF